MEKNGSLITKKLIYCAVHRSEPCSLNQIEMMFLMLWVFFFWQNCSLDNLFHCRVPNPDSVLVVHTPLGVFSPRTSLQNHKGCIRGSRLVSSKNAELLEYSTPETNEFDPMSSARCRIYKRSQKKVTILNCFAYKGIIYVILEFQS